MARILAPDSSPLRRIQSHESIAKSASMASNKEGREAGDSSGSISNGRENESMYARTEFGARHRMQNKSHGQYENGKSSEPSYSNASSSRLDAMARAINARSSNKLPEKSHQANAQYRRERQDSVDGLEEENGVPAQKRFKSSLEQFRYSGPGATPHDAIALDDGDNEGDLSSLSSGGLSEKEAELERASAQVGQKKRRFVRGGPNGPSARGSNNVVEIPDSPEAASTQRRQSIPDSPVISSNARRITTIPDSPASNPSPSKPLKRPSPSATRSLIRPMPKQGIQVTTKTVPRPAHQITAPPAFSKPSPPQTSRAISKTLSRVKESARSTPTTDEDDESNSDDDSDDGYDRESSNERKALQWFNNNSADQLVDIVGLTIEQANIIVNLRPFRSTDDLTRKLSDAKGVNPRMFYNCTDLLSGLQRIDTVLEKCGKMGGKLNEALSSWNIEPGSWLASSSNTDRAYLQEQPYGASDGVELRDFQMYGVNWLNLLYRSNCSGILADDMGLGKTAQVITFLNHIVLQRDRKPHLVVVPSSVLTNWMREFAMFGPELRVFKYHGSQKERVEQQHDLKSDREAYDVVITTYDMASGGDRDHKFLRKYEFDAVIYDEGHVLKNQKSVKYGKLMRIHADWRLLLTGTPLQNNLGELISLLKFIMPMYFRGAEEALAQIFSVSQETQLSRERIQRAKQMMRPFVLRRKKVDVLDSLKSKTEVVKYCDMTDEQRKIYRQSFARSRAALLEQQEREATETRSSRSKSDKSQTLKSGHVLMELRKAANHPLLFRRFYDDRKIDALARDYLRVAEHATDDLHEKKEDFAINSDAELCMSIAMQYKECNKHILPSKAWLNSGKIAALKEVIEEAQAKNERLIVFSQFVQTLEIVCRALEVLGITYRGFTGSTDVNARQELVDEFTRDESITCFLLSTRAGGVGINLTAANWVVLFDQDFNPQNDQQAADRCYRMGQEKEVTIVRLISRGTIDEHIFALGKSKLKLADRVQAQHDEGGAAGQMQGAEEELDQEENQEAMEKKVEKSLLAGIMAADDDGDSSYEAEE